MSAAAKKKSGKGKSKEKDAAAAKPVAEDKHPGYGCLYLGDKELQRYGLKTGDGLLDVKDYKMIEKSFILEEINFMGKMSAFEPYKEKFENFDTDAFLFIWDVDEEKEPECNFYFCCSLDSFNTEKTRLGITGDIQDDTAGGGEKKSKEEIEEEERKKKEEEEKILEEKRITAALKKLKEPIIYKEWKDLGTYNEMLNNKIKSQRKNIQWKLSRRRKYFGNKIELLDLENIDGMNISFKSQNINIKSYQTQMKLCDQSIQNAQQLINKSTQTKWNRKMNKIVQYRFNDASIRINSDNNNNNSVFINDLEDNYCSNSNNNTNNTSNKLDPMTREMSLISRRASIDDLSSKINNNNNNNDNGNIRPSLNMLSSNDNKSFIKYSTQDEHDEYIEKLLNFLDNVSSKIENILTDNSIINTFKDEFIEFVTNESTINDKTEGIKEVQTFVDLNWSRNKRISNIECMPIETNDIVAVSCIQNMTYDERVEIMNESRLSTILLWNLSHVLLRAQMILQAPVDIFVFKFHPKKPNILVGGLETGQVLLWDLSTNDSFFELTGKPINNQTSNNNNNNNNKSDKSKNKQQNQQSSSNNNNNNNNNNNINNSNNDDLLDDDDEKIPQLAPQMLSYIEKSHSQSVTDIIWLPNDIVISKTGEIFYIDVNSRGRTGIKTLEEEQFLSVASDGKILVWNIAKPEQTEKEKKKGEEAKWIPVCSIDIERNKLSQNIIVDPNKEDVDTNIDDNSGNNGNSNGTNSGDINFAADIEVTKKIASNISNNNKELLKDINIQDLNINELDETILGFNISYENNLNNSIYARKICFGPLITQLCIGTELGEFGLYHYGFITKEFLQQRKYLLMENFKNHSTQCGNININTNDNNDDNNENNMTQLQKFENSLIVCKKHSKMYQQHSMRIKTIQISPHFSNMCLTIGDWSFSIWRLGHKDPLVFHSPYAPTYLTCGVWSPTRPGVILTSKIDGTIDVWDLLDQTHAPVFANSPVTSVSITSMRFLDANNATNQQVAVGDAQGNLRILEIPRNFTVPLNNENDLMVSFYRKEHTNMQFSTKRAEILKLQTMVNFVCKKQETENNDKNAENENPKESNVEKVKQETPEEKEAKYQSILASFKKKLGI